MNCLKDLGHEDREILLAAPRGAHCGRDQEWNIWKLEINLEKKLFQNQVGTVPEIPV